MLLSKTISDEKETAGINNIIIILLYITLQTIFALSKQPDYQSKHIMHLRLFV